MTTSNTAADGAQGSGSYGNNDPKPPKKSAKPVVVWDVNNSFIYPQSQEPNAVYLKHERDLAKLTLAVLNGTAFHAALLNSSSSMRGALSGRLRGFCSEVALYTAVIVEGVTDCPKNASQINSALGAPLFSATEVFTINLELRTRYTYQHVAIADAFANLVLLPGFANSYDRASQTNVQDIKVEVEMTELPFNFSAVRQAQSLLEALYRTDTLERHIDVRWKE
jgi:hypothetical protein